MPDSLFVLVSGGAYVYFRKLPPSLVALVVGQLRLSTNERPQFGQVTRWTNKRARPGGGWTEPGRHPADGEAVPHPLLLLLLLYKLHNVKNHLFRLVQITSL